MATFERDADPDLDDVLATVDVQALIERGSHVDNKQPKKSGKRKSKGSSSAAASKRPAAIRGPDGSAYANCATCDKRFPAALLPELGGHGHECGEVDPLVKLKQIHEKKLAREAAMKDKFEASKQAARSVLQNQPACKPKSAYHHFCASRRDALKDERPGLDGKELTAILAEEWAELSNDSKVKYEAFAAADKELHGERMAVVGEVRLARRSVVGGGRLTTCRPL